MREVGITLRQEERSGKVKVIIGVRTTGDFTEIVRKDFHPDSAFSFLLEGEEGGGKTHLLEGLMDTAFKKADAIVRNM